jgi:hypothetical protein
MKIHYKKFLTYQNFLAAEFGLFIKEKEYQKIIVYLSVNLYGF